VKEFIDADDLPDDEWVCRCREKMKDDPIRALANVSAPLPRGFYALGNDNDPNRSRLAVYFCGTCSSEFEFFQDIRYPQEISLNLAEARKLYEVFKKVFGDA
jgi:hypothetical protein